ncbi:MAG: DUF4922 domain-containing protein [Paludibacteraceae bacterium]|nr:DUF4922 domain-containing protein [Paludibacteraceae bacterium]
MFTEDIAETLYENQLKEWDIFSKSVEQLSNIECKKFQWSNHSIIAQFNPARVVSTGAKIDAKTIAHRKCFLCDENRPKEQKGETIIPGYSLLVNPYPILKRHFTIPSNKHTPQCIYDNIGDMIEIAKLMPNYIIFYNGPQSGASAPDHLHFQAVAKGQMPFEDEIEKADRFLLSENKEGKMMFINNIGRKCIVAECKRKDMLVSFFHQIYHQLPSINKLEPQMNVFVYTKNNELRLVVFPRKKHRPDFYGTEKNKWLISPGAIDMGGIFVLPIKDNFDTIDKETICAVFEQVSL